MKNKIKQDVQSVEKSVEILLAGMAFNSNIPVIYLEDTTSDKPKMVGTIMTRLPIHKVDYIETINKIANTYPEYNELLMAIGINLNDKEYEHDSFHAEVVKYLANNDIMYKIEEKSNHWIINFPDEKVRELLESDYGFFLQNSYEFFNLFYNKNFMMCLKKVGDEKSKQLIKS